MIPISRPHITDAEREAVLRPLKSGWLMQGPEVAAFEKEFGAYTGAEHAVAVSSGTAALHLALKAVGVGAGDEVITVSHSYIATANSVRYVGAVPVLVDIDPSTYNIDPARVERAVTPLTRAILCVHQIGMPCDLRRLSEIAVRHGLRLVEDAACAAGSEILVDGAWQRVGRPHGDVATFSFHPRKVLCTGDGGMITSRDPEIAGKCRLWRQHGMDTSSAARHGSPKVVFEEHAEFGFNYRLSDLQAAVGRAQLARLAAFVARRRHLASIYATRLAAIPGLGLPREPEWARTNWQSYCVRLPAGADQRGVMQAMLDRGIATRRGVMCAHLEPPYRSHPGVWRTPEGQDLRHSEGALNGCILLPMYHDLSEDEALGICEALTEVLGGRRT
jgi:dTDP-4-amino-4,6-dideoxygalactose transaminase